MRAAWAFRSFFRSPTSEGLLHNAYSPSIPVNTATYLQRVLAYCAEGGLSAVLDEFFHVTLEAGGRAGAAELSASLCEALQLATGRLDVVEWGSGEIWGVQRRTYPMRQHFARRYANDRTISHDPQAGRTRGRCTRRVQLSVLAVCAGHHFGWTGRAGFPQVLPRRGPLEPSLQPRGPGAARGPCPSIPRSRHSQEHSSETRRPCFRGDPGWDRQRTTQERVGFGL